MGVEETVQEKQILLVEDRPDIQELVKSTLEAEGYSVIVKDRGEDCLDYLKDNQVDAVLLDVMLPKEENDGFYICRQIKSKYQNLPVIIFTAKNSQEDFLTALKAGASDYILKPASKATIVDKVKKALHDTASKSPPFSS